MSFETTFRRWPGPAAWVFAPVPARVRGNKDDGDVATVEVAVDGSRL